MQGKEHYQYRLFSIVNLAEMIAKNHILVRLDKTLTLDFIYNLTQDFYSSDNGRPSIDPVLFFRQQLIEYLFGVHTNRWLCV